MTRVLAVIVLLTLIAGFIYRQGGRDATRDHRENTLQTEKDISDAIKDSDADVSWRDRLLGRN